MFRSDTPTHARRAAPALSRRTAFWALGVTLALFLFASSAPSPLYVVYQSEWGFSTVLLTTVFAIYAVALLAALLTLGSVSDHIGRRPALFGALAIEVIGMLVFAEARSVEWLFAARVLQGIATGIAMGTITAALLDLEPESSPGLGATLGVAAPMTGLAAGALGTGLLVQYGPEPTTFVFWLLLACFVAAAAAVWAIPETVVSDGRWASSVRPRLAVPPSLRTAFVATIPCMAATWALGGLILSLGPSLTAGVLGDASHVAGGMPIFLMAGISAAMSIRVRRAHARTTARGGLAALIAGAAIALLALGEGSTGLFLVGSAVAGLGFGPAFAGAFRALTTRAPGDQRAAFVSAILVVSYLAFSLPAVVAGAAVERFGLLDTADVYGLVVIALAAVALALSGQLEDPAAEGAFDGPAMEIAAQSAE